MNIFEFMDRKTAYTAQELADLMREPLKDVEIELTEQHQKGKIAMQNARGYQFFYINESPKI